MKNRIINYVKAGYPGLYLISHEESRIEGEIKAVADSTQFKLHAWSIVQGVIELEEAKEFADTQDPFAMLGCFDQLPEKSILLARDMHGVLEDRNPMLIRKLRESLQKAKTENRVLVITGCRLNLPAELEKEMTVMEFSLPDRHQLREVLDGIVESAKLKGSRDVERIIDAASGLTTTEAENAFALSIIESDDLTPAIVNREKAQVIKKNGLLEIIESKTTLDDIGGLENLKSDLLEKKNLFTKQAREYGLSAPRGMMAVGQPGTGKSLTAAATASIFNIPLIRLEAGKLFGSLVGQSEGNWRSAFATAKAVAPCILWVDEADGLFAGSKSSGETDSGVTSRVIKAILQDMQFNSEGIFYCFTANDIDGLPDPLIDRLDVYSVDLPNPTERESIWSIHIAKAGRKPAKFDLKALSAATEGFSGRQIEQVWKKAMTLAFNDKSREPKTEDCLTAAKRVVATSVTMAEAIEKRRTRLKNRATPASAPEAPKSTGRKLVK